MLKRCLNPKDKSFKYYGARGITVAPEWLGKGGVAAFLAHIGPKPTPLHTVDRKNNNGNYEPGNVRWATVDQQNRNRPPRAARAT